MPATWNNALNSYVYPVDFRTFSRCDDFHGFFKLSLIGDRFSTIEFERRFQTMGPSNIESFFEVAYWKYYSQANRREQGTKRVVDHVTTNAISPDMLWGAIEGFIQSQTKNNLQRIRGALGIKSRVLALALTFPALASPSTLPMVDNQVARWVNKHLTPHNINRKHTLSPFILKRTSLQDDDFPNYLNWVAWCRETSDILSTITSTVWRPRDVEMAVFTAQRNNMPLNSLDGTSS